MLPVDQLKDLVDCLYNINADLRIDSVVEDDEMVILKLGRESSRLVRVFALPKDASEVVIADPMALAIRVAAADLEVDRQTRPMTYRGCSDPSAVLGLLKHALAGLSTTLSREILRSALDTLPTTDHAMVVTVSPALAVFTSVDSGPTEARTGVDTITALVESGAGFCEDSAKCLHQENYVLMGGKRTRRHGAVEVTAQLVCSSCGQELVVVDEPDGAAALSFHASSTHGGEN
jgi:hypothetical protein